MKRNVKISRATKVFLISFLSTLAILSLLLVIVSKQLLHKPKENSNFWSNLFTSNITKEDMLPMNVLLLGSDRKSGGRSDTIMLINIQNDFKFRIISIPRDTRVKIEGVKGYNKINAAYAYGKGELAVKTVGELLGIKIDKYVSVNYEVVEKLVDLVGGVDINVPFDLNYKDTTPGFELYINIPKGHQHLNGKKAVEFLRWRHNSNGKEYGPGGDLGRIELQKLLINALIDKLLQPQNIIKVPSIINTVIDYTNHNFSNQEIMWFLSQINKIDRNNISMVTLPGLPKWIDGVSYFLNDEKMTKLLVDDLNNKEVSKQDVKILIRYNDKEKALAIKDLLIKSFNDIMLEKSFHSYKSDKIIINRVNNNYYSLINNCLLNQASNYEISIVPNYNIKYDLIFEIKKD